MLLMEATVTPTAFGIEVRRLRLKAGLSQERLAAKLGKSREAISQIERGETQRPEDDTLLGLEEHIGLSRQRSYQLMGAVPGEDQSAATLALLYQVAAIEDDEERRQAWYSIPDPLRQAILKLSGDRFVEIGQQLQAAARQTNPDP